MLRSRWPAYRVWLVYSGSWAFVRSLSWTTAAVYLVRDVGMSPLLLVLTGTALEVAYFLSEVPTGVLADLYSRRLSMIVAALVSGVALVAAGSVAEPGAVLAAMALYGFGWTFRSGAEDAWVADELGPDQLGRAYQRGAQAERLAGLAGIGGAVALAQADLGLPLIASGLVALALGGFMALAMPEEGFVRPPRSAGRLGPLRDAAATVAAGRRVVAAQPALLLVLMIALLLGAWSEGWDRLWEAHLLLDIGLPALPGGSDVAWFGVLNAGGLFLSYAVSAPLVARLEKLGRARLVRLLVLLHAALIAAALVFALAGSFAVAIAAWWATYVARDLAGPPFRTWLNSSITDSSVRATVLSVTNLADSGGQWTGGPLLGWVGTRWGVRAALAAGTLALLPVLGSFARAGRSPADSSTAAGARSVH